MHGTSQARVAERNVGISTKTFGPVQACKVAAAGEAHGLPPRRCSSAGTVTSALTLLIPWEALLGFFCYMTRCESQARLCRHRKPPLDRLLVWLVKRYQYGPICARSDQCCGGGGGRGTVQGLYRALRQRLASAPTPIPFGDFVSCDGIRWGGPGGPASFASLHERTYPGSGYTVQTMATVKRRLGVCKGPRLVSFRRRRRWSY